MNYWVQLATEQFPPSELVEQAIEAERIVSSDPDHHVKRIREVGAMGATVVCLQNGSRADPLGALRTYRERVLPALAVARV